MATSSLPHLHANLSYSEAAATVQGYAAGLRCERGAETVGLLDALGRVLAEPIVADREQPPFARSTRDGFACRAGDLAAALTVVGLLKAGEAWTGTTLGAGQAVEIMTGAPLPTGADCVVMVEHVVREGSAIRLESGRTLQAGENFIAAGAEAGADSVLAAAGTRLGTSQLAAAAAVGASRLTVYRRPRVAILSTGDELVGIKERPRIFEIRNSNSYSLAAQVLAVGGEPLIQAIARDSEAALEQAIRRAIHDGCELLLLSGGVSMGKYDLVESVLGALGAGFLFTGVRMQPGKPVVFGEMAGLAGGAGRMPFLGLPGNPVSTMVTFALFAAPVLAALGGERGYRPRFAEARLAAAVELKAGLRKFLPARLTADADGAEVALVPWQGSGDLAGTAQANCFMVVPELEPGGQERRLQAGETVRVLQA